MVRGERDGDLILVERAEHSEIQAMQLITSADVPVNVLIDNLKQWVVKPQLMADAGWRGGVRCPCNIEVQQSPHDLRAAKCVNRGRMPTRVWCWCVCVCVRARSLEKCLA